MKSALLLVTLFAARTLVAAELPLHNSDNTSLRNEVQIAIDKGLAWLQKNQNPDGSWSLADYPALTAMPLTGFMLEPSGKFKAEKPEFIQKGYGVLMASVQPDGGIYRKGLANYNTSISLVALIAANDPKYIATVQQARDFVIGQQAKGLVDQSLDGGIGYGPKGTAEQKPDLSNTAIALEALYRSKIVTGSAEVSHAKDLDWKAVIGFIERCQNLPSVNKEKWASDDPDNKGGFIYSPGNSKSGEMKLPNGRVALRSYGSMSYAGLLSYLYADVKKDDARVQAVVDWLQRHYTLDENPGMGADGLFYYYQMMAKALSAYGSPELQLADGKKVDWRKEMALKLIDLQKGDGSWANESGRWMEKDPVLVTSYCVFTLEYVYNSL